MLIACRRCHRQYDVQSIEPGRKVRCFCGELNTVPEARSVPTKMAHCFACGGPIQDGGSDCNYCGGTVSLLMRGAGDPCPECFARLPRDARFCAGCGVEIAPGSTVKALQSTRCPRCKGQLAQCEGEGGSFTECLACGGLWLDEPFFRQLIAGRTSGSGSGPRPSSSPGAPSPSHEATIRYLKCPHCAELMHRSNFGRGSGIILDWCSGHGVWLDTNELDQVLAYAEQRPEHATWESRRGRRPASAAPASSASNVVGHRSDASRERSVGGLLVDVVSDVLSAIF